MRIYISYGRCDTITKTAGKEYIAGEKSRSSVNPDMDFKRIIEKLPAAFKDQSIRYALMGRFAMALLGRAGQPLI